MRTGWGLHADAFLRLVNFFLRHRPGGGYHLYQVHCRCITEWYMDYAIRYVTAEIARKL